MAWTSNGVDSNGDLDDLGPATRYIRDNHYDLVYPSGSSSTPTPTPTPTPSDDVTVVNDTDFSYTGTWETASDPDFYNGDEHYTYTSGAYYEYTFNSTKVDVYGTNDAHHGIAEISIDGGTPVDVDFYNSSRQEQTLVWSSDTLSEGTHTIRASYTGRKNSSSTGYVITADKLEIYSSSGSSTTYTYEAEEGALTGSYTIYDKADASGGKTVALWDDSSSSITFTVDGGTGGSKNMDIRYLYTYDSTVRKFYVNSNFVKEVSFTQASDFTTVTETVNLNSDSNTIKLQANAGPASLDIDCITLTE
ncbi:CBM35 domain-containing protein [Petroclostridium xylanilyticum]|uniref:CBM35 domain-containing protein n=1 Tax=Petroclostridium xylanilyticum TaxID=1792311 RepID=UPI0012FFB738|nr:CBM35 domain-containing protein [Petroclostridium xylanilyticum]